MTGGGVDPVDHALDRIARTGPEYLGGLSNHGPMVVEVLHRRGVTGIAGWLAAYENELEPLPPPGGEVRATAWRDGLGDAQRSGAWAAWFARAMEEEPWEETLRRWLPVLAPGMAAAAGHGLLRTAHAVSLLGEPTSSRLAELARGLGYWASRYQTLPGVPHLVGHLDVADAVAQIGAPQQGRDDAFLITGAMRALDGDHRFAEWVDSLREPKDAAVGLATLTSQMASVFVAGPARSAIALVHGVTVPSAVRFLVPYLEEATARSLFGWVWQFCVAISALFADHDRQDVPLGGADAAGFDGLFALAVEHGDPHVIKMVDACWREADLAASVGLDPAPYCVAAGEVAARIDPLER